jgi:DNA-binding NtrC family response regulator
MDFNGSSTQSMDSDEHCTVIGLRMTTTGEMFELDPEQRRWVLGSSSSADFIIKTDPFISGAHCVLERRSDGVVIVRDRGSRNGTVIDGNRIEAAELRVGSYLTVGRSTFVALAAAGGASPASAIEAMRGQDGAFRDTIDQALRAAQTDCNVLIVGETGTGKDLLAKAVHEGSKRSAGPYVAVNCGAIPRELIACELFGHDKGAFTGAHAERDGYFVEANGGTLFLDEIGELPLEMQPSLLRVLETRRVRRVGGGIERAVDVRIVAATNRMDGLGTDSSRLRVDLYHRLATVVLSLPPLRERMGDIVILVEAMLEELEPQYGGRRVSEDAWCALTGYTWPGNVRELRHAVARAVTLGGDLLQPRDFFSDIGMRRRGELLGHVEPMILPPYLLVMKNTMEQALATYGSIRAAAKHLGMPKSTFADKAKAWGLLPRRKSRNPKG